MFLDFHGIRLRTLTYLIRNFQKFQPKKEITQRILLKFVASIFDPLGFAAHLTIRLRKILQSVWSQGPKWDKVIEPSSIPDSIEWKNEIQTIETLHVPRNLINSTEIITRDLNVFTDASEFALLAVAFLGIAHKDNTVSVQFLIGKARVAPIKRMTIPNLELQAVVYGAQMANFIVEESYYKICNQHFWSDSTTVLYWLRTPQIRHKIFVTKRLAKILDICNPHDWKYVPTKDNLVDDGPRGYTVEKMTIQSRWLQGPQFLWKDQSHWPQQDLLQLNQTTVQMMPANISTVKCHTLKPLKFSNWNMLIRSVAFCYLAVDKFKKRSSHLKLSHHAKAYIHLIQFCQESDFSVEYADLKKNSHVSSSSRIRTLWPFIDDHDRIRARDRLSKAPFLITFRYPIILDGSNHIVKLLVKITHIVNSHS